MKTVNTQIKGTQQISSRRNMRKTILNHLKIKLLQSNAKEKILKPARGRSLITYTRTEKKVTSGFSSETMYTGKEIKSYLQSTKRKKKISLDSFMQKKHFSKIKTNNDCQAYES